MVIKYREGSRDALDDGWDRTYSLKLYKDTVLDPDGELSDFTEATATSGYSAKTLLWADATIEWDADLSKYKATWATQTWTDIIGLDADGWFISDGTFVFSAEEVSLGANYTELNTVPVPTIIMG